MRQVQTILAEEVLEELKKKSGKDTVKDAIAKAIDHYLSCSHTEDTMKKRLEDTMKRRKG